MLTAEVAPHFQSMRYELHMTLHSLTCPHSHHLYSPFSITTHSDIVQVMPDCGNRNGECAPLFFDLIGRSEAIYTIMTFVTLTGS